MAYGSLIESESIRDLTIRRVDLPLEHPVETASGVLRTAALVLVDVRDADGVFGHAYLRTYTPVALRALATLLEDLAPLVTGEPTDPAAVRARLQREFKVLGAQGLAGAAIAGIDMALWDLAARRADVPLAALLGSDRRRVPAYASLHAMAPDTAAAEAEAALAADFAGHTRIAAATPVPIQLGENWQGPGDVEKSLAAAASDPGMPDAMKIGGVSGWREAAALAAGAGLPLSSHTFGRGGRAGPAGGGRRMGRGGAAASDRALTMAALSYDLGKGPPAPGRPQG